MAEWTLSPLPFPRDKFPKNPTIITNGNVRQTDRRQNVLSSEHMKSSHNNNKNEPLQSNS